MNNPPALRITYSTIQCGKTRCMAIIIALLVLFAGIRIPRTGSTSGLLALELDQRGNSKPVLHVLPWENTTWIGNLYVPPPGAKLYSPFEIQNLLGQHSILIIGDSTGRRLWYTMLELLNSSNNTGTNVDTLRHISTTIAYKEFEKDQHEYFRHHPFHCPKWAADDVLCQRSSHGSFCEKNLQTGKSIDFYGLHSYWMVERFTQQCASRARPLWNATQHYTLLIIAVGLWEVLRPWDCRAPDDHVSALNDLSMMNNTSMALGTQTKIHLMSLIVSLDEMIASRKRNNLPDLLVVWRTSGFRRDLETSNLVEAHIRLSIDLVKSRANQDLTYLDWGSAIRPRSFGTDRIVGDINAHYGAEARLLMVQMLANTVDTRGKNQLK